MNRTLSTVLDFVLIPAAATVAVVGMSFAFATPADAFWGKSKRELCANYTAQWTNDAEVKAERWRKLGIEGEPYSDGTASRDTIKSYCEFYKK